MEKEVKEFLVEEEQERYQEYIKQVTPTHKLGVQMIKAFLVGGIICVFGQFLINFATTTLGFDAETAGSFCTLILIATSVLLTGLGVYPRIAKFAGAGTLVPITGFANSVTAPAIEYKKEGQVMGIGCKIFTIAGPVILYGIFFSWVLGIVYWGMTLTK
ncbi:MAG: SpoVA/SpoVAEb family sporulation membrane protein [Eubacteriales bacterium]